MPTFFVSGVFLIAYMTLVMAVSWVSLKHTVSFFSERSFACKYTVTICSVGLQEKCTLTYLKTIHTQAPGDKKVTIWFGNRNHWELRDTSLTVFVMGPSCLPPDFPSTQAVGDFILHLLFLNQRAENHTLIKKRNEINLSKLFHLYLVHYRQEKCYVHK